ncbi:hypothetical protein AB0H51_23745 [Streptomyces griseoluteus]
MPGHTAPDACEFSHGEFAGSGATSPTMGRQLRSLPESTFGLGL